jgi:hypothetical protein
MRHLLTARELLIESFGALGLGQEEMSLLFADTPVDFPVIFSGWLPLFVHRFGMVGITLFGRVYLLDQARTYPIVELIAIVRHEAEHVRQQREAPFLFYIRYVGEWLVGLIGGKPGRDGSSARQPRDRWHRAYRAIAAEQEAYRAERGARQMLRYLLGEKTGTGTGEGVRGK